MTCVLYFDYVVEPVTALHGDYKSFTDILVGNTTARLLAERLGVRLCVSEYIGPAGGNPELMVAGDLKTVEEFYFRMTFGNRSESEVTEEEKASVDLEYMSTLIEAYTEKELDEKIKACECVIR